MAETAEKAGCLAGAGLVVILALALTAYGATQFQQDAPTLGVKTLSGREVARDPLQVPAPRPARLRAPPHGAARRVLLSEGVCWAARVTQVAQLLCCTCAVGLWCASCLGPLSRSCILPERTLRWLLARAVAARLRRPFKSADSHEHAGLQKNGGACQPAPLKLRPLARQP